jgi:polyisoprenoid-binding protein YceI
MNPRLLFALLFLTVPLLHATDLALIVDKAKSRVEIPVKVTADSFIGTLSDYEAILYADATGEKVTAAKFAFQFADVKTGNPKRDAAMNAWQQTDKFPTGAFTLAGLTAAGPGKFVASGRLTLHGAARDLTFPVTIGREGAAFTIDGEAEIDTREFGLPVLTKFMVFKVDPLVKVKFHLVAGAVAPAGAK